MNIAAEEVLREGVFNVLFNCPAHRSGSVLRVVALAHEELASLVTLQNSYSAAARVMSTATQMYDTLIGMVGR